MPRRHVRLQFGRLETRTVPTTFSVTNLNDSGTGSLRQAVINANSDMTFGPHVVDATGVSGSISLSGGQIAITTSQGLIINGSGSSKLTIDAAYASRIVDVQTTAPVTVNGM